MRALVRTRRAAFGPGRFGRGRGYAPRRADVRRRSRSPHDATDAARGPSPSGGNATRVVLIVDDEPSIRLICNINLAASGWRCLEAQDGVKAIEVVKRERPDVVLLDAMMPNLDGWATAEKLTADPATRDIPIVFLTAKADRRDRKQAHDVGAVAFLAKPINPVTLSDILDGVIDRLADGQRDKLRAEMLEDV